jgi:hypothetical protein
MNAILIQAEVGSAAELQAQAFVTPYAFAAELMLSAARMALRSTRSLEYQEFSCDEEGPEAISAICEPIV